MCVDGDILDSSNWKIVKLICFSYFGYEFKIKTSVMHEHVMNIQEHVKNAYKQHSSISRIFKHIQAI